MSTASVNEQPRPAWDQEMRRAGLAALRRIVQGGPDQDGAVMPPARAAQILAGWMLECMARLDALEGASPTGPYRAAPAGKPAAEPTHLPASQVGEQASEEARREQLRGLIHHELARAWDQGWEAGWKQAGDDPQLSTEISTDDTDQLGWRSLTAYRYMGHTYTFRARQRGTDTYCSVTADNPWQAVLDFAETRVIDPGTVLIEVSGGNLPPNVITLWWLRRRTEPTWETKEAGGGRYPPAAGPTPNPYRGA